MEGDGFDPCECVWSHNMAMRRLLAFLRQSQTYCTDSECLMELPGNNVDSSDQTLYFMLVGWAFVTMLWFMLRPNPVGRQGEDLMKGRNNDNEPDDNSSGPPPLS